MMRDKLFSWSVFQFSVEWDDPCSVAFWSQGIKGL